MPTLRFLYQLLIFSLLFSVSFVFGKTEQDVFYHTNVRNYIHKYCVSCHNSSDKKGGIDLADYFFAISVIRNGELFQHVADLVQSRQMPPEGKPQLTDAEVEIMVNGINKLLGDALEKPDPGIAIMRRLSHREYQYTIKDLIGIDVNVRDLLPSEGSVGSGFDNQAGGLFITPLMMERYFGASDSILRHAFRSDKIQQKLIPISYQPSWKFRWKTWWNRQMGNAEINFEKAREVAHKSLIPFATRAYRRFLSQEEQNQLMDFFETIYKDSWQEDNGFEIAIQATMKGILVSPNFLYRLEENLELESPYTVSNFELATRISYLLWSSMPDETLFNAAYRENLHDPKVLNREVLRMMADPKFERFAEGFASQWLDIDEIVHDPGTDMNKFPEFTEGLRTSMYQEAVQYFYHVFAQSRNLLELIDSDYAMLNESLAKHYGIEGISGDELRTVALTDRSRGGVLGMGAVLTASSLPLRTSPVIRGKWVLERLLGTPPPPPPPDVPELEAAKESVKTELDLRELLSFHRSPSSCAGCHQKMDPIGLGLENFDAIGRWRDGYDETQSIEASGVLVTGRSFSGPAELKEILHCEEQEKFAKNFSRNLLSYAIGRGIGFKDMLTINQLKDELLETGFDSQALMLKLVNSYPFRYKRSDLPSHYEGT